MAGLVLVGLAALAAYRKLRGEKPPADMAKITANCAGQGYEVECTFANDGAEAATSCVQVTARSKKTGATSNSSVICSGSLPAHSTTKATGTFQDHAATDKAGVGGADLIVKSVD
jgi:hypothetical protein